VAQLYATWLYHGNPDGLSNCASLSRLHPRAYHFAVSMKDLDYQEALTDRIVPWLNSMSLGSIMETW